MLTLTIRDVLESGDQAAAVRLARLWFCVVGDGLARGGVWVDTAAVAAAVSVVAAVAVFATVFAAEALARVPVPAPPALAPPPATLPFPCGVSATIRARLASALRLPPRFMPSF